MEEVERSLDAPPVTPGRAGVCGGRWQLAVPSAQLSAFPLSPRVLHTQAWALVHPLRAFGRACVDRRAQVLGGLKCWPEWWLEGWTRALG